MELYNKDSITCEAHTQIFKEELQKVDRASEDFVDYVDELLTQLEIDKDDNRIADIDTMRKYVIGAVKEHKQQIMEKINSMVNQNITSQNINPLAPHRSQQAEITHSNGSTDASVVPKLNLKHGNILEDIEDFLKIIEVIKM